MSKLLVVFGATGQQGGSIVKTVLSDPKLSQEWRVRALTRDPTAEKAKALEKLGAEVVACEQSDYNSVWKAVDGAHTVFAMTLSVHDRDRWYTEVVEGKIMASLSVAAGAKYLIWSSMVNVTKLSGGHYTKVHHFDSKAIVEDYIRTLPIKSIHYIPGSFMQNLSSMFRPQPAGDGTFVVTTTLKPETELPFIEVAADTGKFIAPVLEDPDKYAGKQICAATKHWTVKEAVDMIAQNTGKTITVKTVPVETLKPFMPPKFDVEYLQMTEYIRDYGYYGKDRHELVGWAAKQAKGDLTDVKDYINGIDWKLDEASTAKA